MLLKNFHVISNKIEEIANKYKVRITEVEDPCFFRWNLHREDFINESCCIEKEEIILGIYDNEEKKIATLFYLLGYMTLDPSIYKTQYDREKTAWEIGFQMAAYTDVTFLEETLDWCNKKLNKRYE